jgi:indolepyruvate ferredoxin oxidoreductase alpha subunit
MVWNKAKFVFIVFDNKWTAMTGHQPNPGTGLTAVGGMSDVVSIEEICRSVGIKYVKTIDPYDVRNAQKVIAEALDYDGPAVIVARRLCALEAVREKTLGYKTYRVLDEKCSGCKVCLRLGCPAISFDLRRKKADIVVEHPYLSCVGCDVCAQVCPMRAIVRSGEAK